MLNVFAIYISCTWLLVTSWFYSFKCQTRSSSSSYFLLFKRFQLIMYFIILFSTHTEFVKLKMKFYQYFTIRVVQNRQRRLFSSRSRFLRGNDKNVENQEKLILKFEVNISRLKSRSKRRPIVPTFKTEKILFGVPFQLPVSVFLRNEQ